MKVLLVVGLAAVIIVILIAVVLSVRLGRGDDHEERAPASGGRGRRDDADPRRDDADPRWRDRSADESWRRSGRPAMQARAGGQRPLEAAAQTGPPRDRGARRPARDRTVRGGDYDRPQRPDDRFDTGPLPVGQARSQVAMPAQRSGSSRGYAGRARGGTGRGRHDNGPALYDTGPPARNSVGDFPSGPFPAADFPSGPMAAADFTPAEYGTGDFPSGELAATPPRGRSAGQSADPARDRQVSRRKQAKQQGPAKARSAKPRGKRDHDDDWPSLEWDNLSDEQYWAELSSDKPLSTSARSPQSASKAKSAAPKSTQSRPAEAQPGRVASRPVAPEPLAAPEPARRRDLAGRKVSGAAREAVTERLPVRASIDPLDTGRPVADPPHAAGEPSIAVLASLAAVPTSRPPGALDEDPLTSPSFSRPAIDSRSYSTTRSSAQSGDTGAHARASGGGAGSPNSGYRSGDGPANGYRNGAHQVPSHAYGPPGYGDQNATDAGYAHPGYAYRAEPAQPGGWYSADGNTPVQGNPYGSYVDPAPTVQPGATAGYPDALRGTGYAGYPAQAGAYPQPTYEPSPSALYPAEPFAGMPAQADLPGQFPPSAGYPENGGYPNEYVGETPYPELYEGNPGYGPSYPRGYIADPYGHDGYGGHSTAQG